LPAVKPTIAFTFTQQKHRIHREKGPTSQYESLARNAMQSTYSVTKVFIFFLFRNFPSKIEKYDFYSRKARTILSQHIDL